MKYKPQSLQGAYPRYGIHTSVFAVHGCLEFNDILWLKDFDVLPPIQLEPHAIEEIEHTLIMLSVSI